MNPAQEKMMADFESKLVGHRDKIKQLVDDRTEAVESNFTRIVEAKGGEIAKHTEEINEISSQMAKLKGEINEEFVAIKAEASRSGSGARGASLKGLGEMVTASKAYESLVEAANHTKSGIDFTVDIPEGFAKHAARAQYLKDLTSGAGSMGDLVVGDRQPMISSPVRRFRMRDLLGGGVTTSNSIEYVEETGFYELYTTVVSGAGAGTNTAVVDNGSGLFPGQALRFDRSGADETMTVQSVGTVNVTTGNATVTFTANFGSTHAAGADITATTFVYTPETYLRPIAEMEIDLLTAPVKTLATGISASRQILDDAPMLESHVRNRLMQAMMLSEEQQYLYGTGAGPEIQGIMTHTRTQTYSRSSVPSDEKVDAIRRAMTLGRLSEYEMTGVVAHPSDWEDIVLTKGTDGHYLWVNVPTGNGQTQLWNLPVVETTAINAGSALVGAFGIGAKVYDRQQSSIRVFDQHKDYAQRGMIYIQANNRHGLTIDRPESFVNVTL